MESIVERTIYVALANGENWAVKVENGQFFHRPENEEHEIWMVGTPALYLAGKYREIDASVDQMNIPQSAA